MSNPSRRTSTRPGGRVHRLPKHRQLDYILVPAPDDLALDRVTEKSPLPAIIVTPSSPSSNKDFSIAFLAPARELSVREKVAEYLFAKPEVSVTLNRQSPASPPITTNSNECWWRGAWRKLRTPSNPPIALPITSPIGDAPSSWHADPPKESHYFHHSPKGVRPRLSATAFALFAVLVVLVVFLQVFSRFSAYRASGIEGMADAGVGVALGEAQGAHVHGHGRGNGHGAGWVGVGGWHHHDAQGFRGADLRIPASPTAIPAALRSALARNEV